MVSINSPRADYDPLDDKVTLSAEDISFTTGDYRTRTTAGNQQARIFYRSKMKEEGSVAVVSRIGQFTDDYWIPLNAGWREGNAKATAEARVVVNAYESQIAAGDETQAEVNVNDSYSLRDLAEFSGQAPVLMVSMPTTFEWLDDNSLSIQTGTFQFQPALLWTAKLSVDGGTSLLVRPGESFVADRGIVSLVGLQHDSPDGVQVWGGDFTEPTTVEDAFAYSANFQYSYMTMVEEFDGASTHVAKIYRINDDIETPEDESGWALFGTLSDQTTASGVHEGEGAGTVDQLMRFGNYDTLEEAQEAAQAQLDAWVVSIGQTEQIQRMDEQGYEVETFTRGGNTFSLSFVRNTDDGERKYSLKHGIIVVASITAVDDEAAKRAAPGHADLYNLELERQARERDKKDGDAPNYWLWALVAGGVIIVGFIIYRRVRDGGAE